MKKFLLIISFVLFCTPTFPFPSFLKRLLRYKKEETFDLDLYADHNPLARTYIICTKKKKSYIDNHAIYFPYYKGDLIGRFRVEYAQGRRKILECVCVAKDCKEIFIEICSRLWDIYEDHSNKEMVLKRKDSILL